MSRLVAAPDKFRGTARAPEVAAAAARAGRRLGWLADEVPLADGGEGLLDAVGGERRTTVVTGPLGRPVAARWQLLTRVGTPPTAVVEMAEAAGRHLVPTPGPDDPVDADTTGVGELVRAAVVAGARTVVVGCGGSATTDGGWGAVAALGSAAALDGAELLVACDVTTPFADAAAVFGPQKGATAAQVALLGERLRTLAGRYRDGFGVDVDDLPGAGAAGGLAGGLAALGGRIVPGFELVASLVGLPERLAGADLVVTGEGHLDVPSLAGKVVGGVIGAAAGQPVLCVVGDADAEVLALLPDRVRVVSLVAEAGPAAARRDTVALVEAVVAAHLGALGSGPLAGRPR